MLLKTNYVQILEKRENGNCKKSMMKAKLITFKQMGKQKAKVKRSAEGHTVN